MRLLSVIGTRPEAVKMAPVLRALRREPGIESLVCLTGQHRDLAAPVLGLFGLSADRDLALMEPGQALNPLLGRAVDALDRLLAETAPDRVLVHGDTTTALAAALAAFHRSIPVAHVEAGLRSGSLSDPFPEEMNRRTVDLVSDLLFAPTREAADNLAAERVPGRILVTGNSGIDALRLTLARLRDPALRSAAEASLPPLDPERRLVLVTAHRRESFGAPFRRICGALARIAARGDSEIVWPLHPNPKLAGPASRLAGSPQIHLVPPLGLAAFALLLRRADLVLTDSGGVQEEAAALGRPTLVLREATERPEGLRAGAARLVGTGAAAIVREASLLLDAPRAAPHSGPLAPLYGDGRAARRIAAALAGRTAAAFDEAPLRPDLRLIAG